jgi:two-component system, sensor histidine kinase LadS
MFTLIFSFSLIRHIARARVYVSKRFVQALSVALLLCHASLPGFASHGPAESGALPSLAAPQSPQQAVALMANTKPSSAMQPLELGPQVNRLDVDTASTYWIDDSGVATITEVDARQATEQLFMPRTSAQRHAIHGKAVWLRFDTRITDARSHWFLELQQATADDVTLYWRDAGKQWVKLQSGDVVPRVQWPVLDRFPVFQLNPPHLATTTYYVRVVHSRSSFSAPLHIYRDTALVAQRQTEHFFLGTYFGLIALVCLVCLVMALAMRDNSFLYYAVYAAMIGLSQAGFTGIAAQHLWTNAPQWADLSVFFLASMAAATGLWFVRSMVRPRVYMPTLDGLTMLLVGMELVVAFVDLLYPSLAGYWLSNGIILAISLVVYVIIWNGWTRGDTTMRWIALGFLPVVLGVIPPLLHNAGLIGTNFFTQYGVTLGSALEMPMLLYGLVLRSATRREGRARTAGLPTQDALTGLSNTRDLLRHIHGAMTRAARYKQQYGLVLVELTNYDWFVKEHGREVSDRALVLLGTRLQLIARDVDTAGRIDSNHFVLLMEGPCKPSHAAKVAAQIAACAYRPTDLLPVGASLKLQVTCALMPDAEALALGDDANAQLGWLLDSSESLQSTPSKTLRTLNF